MRKKGYTLVEVLVSIFLFTAMTITCFTTYLLGKKYQIKESEYVFFEGVCLDIDKYSDAYRDSKTTTWNQAYFGNDLYLQSYDADYNHVSNKAEQVTYQLSFSYELKEGTTDTKELIVNVKNIISDYSVIKNLNYGSARYLNILNK